jgi:flagellar FliJ protein
MKKYQFRLEAVLKLRKFKEESCRMEMGRLLMDLNKIDDQLLFDKNEIENYYKIQEGALKTGIAGSQLQAFPMLVAAKERNIELLHIDRKKQVQLVEEKKQELAMLRGELKVIENLKEKDFDAYKKAVNKEIDQKVEEQTQIWMQYREKKA